MELYMLEACLEKNELARKLEVIDIRLLPISKKTIYYFHQLRLLILEEEFVKAVCFYEKKKDLFSKYLDNSKILESTRFKVEALLGQLNEMNQVEILTKIKNSLENYLDRYELEITKSFSLLAKEHIRILAQADFDILFSILIKSIYSEGESSEVGQALIMYIWNIVNFIRNRGLKLASRRYFLDKNELENYKNILGEMYLQTSVQKTQSDLEKEFQKLNKKLAFSKTKDNEVLPFELDYTPEDSSFLFYVNPCFTKQQYQRIIGIKYTKKQFSLFLDDNFIVIKSKIENYLESIYHKHPLCDFTHIVEDKVILNEVADFLIPKNFVESFQKLFVSLRDFEVDVSSEKSFLSGESFPLSQKKVEDSKVYIYSSFHIQNLPWEFIFSNKGVLNIEKGSKVVGYKIDKFSSISIFGAPPAIRSSQGNIVVDYLPNTLIESESIHDLLMSKQIQSQLFVGEDCNIENVINNAVNSTVLHFACHGVGNEINPEKSCLILSAEKEGDGINPFLTFFEICDLDLHHVKLVVLSSCNGHIGYKKRGENIQSLVYAFLKAGVQYVIATKGPVGDYFSSVFIQKLYSYLFLFPPNLALFKTKQFFINETENTKGKSKQQLANWGVWC